jgi:tripartite-type tricarboxylate transporter receptor subunit TctC
MTSPLKCFQGTLLYLLATATVLPLVTQAAVAQAYPTRPVRIVVGFPPGGNTDIAARIVAQWLSERLRQQFIIENRPGASGNIATEAVVRSPADGYTLLAATSGDTLSPALQKNLGFNFVNDIAMVAGIVRSPLVLEVHPAVPARTLAEFIAYAKSNPGKISMASFGTASVSQLVGDLFKVATGLAMVPVPYRGSAPMVADLLAGHVTAAFDNLPASIEQIRAGKLRPLGVTTSMRSEVLPDVPSMTEFLQGFEVSAWAGIGAPKNTPPGIVERLSREINAGLADPAIEARIANMGGTPFIASTADLAKFVADQTTERAMMVKAAKMNPQ